MGVATATFVDTFKARDWRYFDVQLLLYMVLLIAIGVVMGYSAGFNDPSASAGMTQTVKTLIWASIGLILFFVAASVDYRWLRTLAVPMYVAVIGLLTVTIRDEGTWRPPDRDPGDRGRGLLIMRQLVDTVTLDERDRGTTITLTRPDPKRASQGWSAGFAGRDRRRARATARLQPTRSHPTQDGVLSRFPSAGRTPSSSSAARRGRCPWRGRRARHCRRGRGGPAR